MIARGYTRHYGSFKRIAGKLRALKPKKIAAKKKSKPYARASYPGQKMQMDVKHVPSECIVGGKPYYQFTACSGKKAAAQRAHLRSKCTEVDELYQKDL